MKRTKEIIGIVVVILITLCSCSDTNVEQAPLLKKIVEIYLDGSSNITSLAYDGNKIVNIDKFDAYLEFYYTGDLVSKIVELDKNTLHKNTLEYSYSDGQLTKIVSSDNYVLNYITNTDGSVSYEKLTKDSNNIEVRNYHGILYFQNKNLIKDEKILDEAGQEILAEYITSFEYDYKNNALHNILGFDKLLNFSKMVSTNNDIIRTESFSVKHIDDDQVISGIKRYDSKYQYNSNGYPTEIISENTVFGTADSNHLKSQLFYD